MKRNREELEKTLYLVIENNLSSRRKILNNLVQKLNDEHNISAGKVKMIFNKSESIPIQTLSNAELYVFTKALYQIIGRSNLKISDWFNDEEIKAYDSYKAQTFYKGDVAVFYNVDQVSENQWVCSKETWVELSKKLNQGLITYNIRTQRETTTITFNNIAAEIPTIKSSAVQNITNLMVLGKFTPNTITLNIRKIGTEQFDYDAKNRTLSVAIDNETTFLDIPDGMHRTLAGSRAAEQKPDLELFTIINILNYTEDDAQQFIEQEDHRTPINPSHLAAFKNDDNGVIMAKYLNKFGNNKNNEMFNTIAINDNELKTSNSKYLTIEQFAKAFNYNWTIDKPREFSKIQKYMVDYFNECIGIIKEKHIDQSQYLSSNMFIGYLAVSSYLYKKDNWKELLEILIDIVTSTDNTELEKINAFINSNKFTTPILKKISDYFKKMEANL